MTEPTSREQYEARFHRNVHLSGHGLATTVHMPCPFCGAEDFLAYPILEMERSLCQPTTCAECLRTLQGIVTHTATGTNLTLFQTAGPDPAGWIAIERP